MCVHQRRNTFSTRCCGVRQSVMAGVVNLVTRLLSQGWRPLLRVPMQRTLNNIMSQVHGLLLAFLNPPTWLVARDVDGQVTRLPNHIPLRTQSPQLRLSCSRPPGWWRLGRPPPAAAPRRRDGAGRRWTPAAPCGPPGEHSATQEGQVLVGHVATVVTAWVLGAGVGVWQRSPDAPRPLFLQLALI